MCNIEQIIEKCKNGDRNAAEKIYRKYAAEMFAVCIRFTNNRADAEDILQDGFIKIFNSIGKYSGKGSFEGWMRRVFVNMCLEQYRKRQSMTVVDNLPDTAAADIEDDIDDNVDIPVDVLQRFVNELPDKYRMVFGLYVVENMKHKEIATALGISEGTSKSNLARARELLKTKIKEYIENER